MTTFTRRPDTSVASRRREVIAGLISGESAPAVAAAAVLEAVHRGTTVRFLQVTPEAPEHQINTAADAAVFSGALHALHRHSRIHSTFETVRGQPRHVLVQRSRGASLLVVGEDQATTEGSIAHYCRQHAYCDVATVPIES